MKSEQSLYRFRVNGPLLAIVVLYLVFNLIGLTRSPLLWVDEATLNDAARELALSGSIRSSVFSDVPSFAKGYYWQPPLQTAISLAVYKVFGFGIWQTRIPPLVFAAASLFVLGCILARLNCVKYVSVLSVIMLGFDPVFSFLARSGRMDSMCLFFLLVSMWSSLQARSTLRLGWSMLTGLALGAAGISHPIAAGMGIGLVVAHALYVHPRLKHSLVVLCCAAVLPLSWFAYAWLSGEWSFFTAQFLQHGNDHLVASSLLQKCANEIGRYARDYARAPILPVVYLVAVISCVRLIRLHGAKDVIMVCVWFVSALVFNTVFMTKDVGFYGLYPVTVAVVMLAFGASEFVRTISPTNNRFLVVSMATIVLGLFAVGPGGRLAVTVHQWNERDPNNLRDAIATAIPQGSKVYGEGMLWYAAHDLNYSLLVDDYFLGKAFPKRLSQLHSKVDYIVLEKKQALRANLSPALLVDSIVITAPSFSNKSDTLYHLLVWGTKTTNITASSSGGKSSTDGKSTTSGKSTTDAPASTEATTLTTIARRADRNTDFFKKQNGTHD